MSEVLEAGTRCPDCKIVVVAPLHACASRRANVRVDTTEVVLAEKLDRAKQEAQEVLDRFPEEAYGLGKLEQAIGFMGEIVDEIERVADNAAPSGARAE